ncbi:MAG: DUF305 domain-containing protein [Gemmatimonas sp.]|nr:DUF305 domain-containing protein [Gemmatimonas sp.]
MTLIRFRSKALLALLFGVLPACSAATAASVPPAPPPIAPASEADIEFLTGMIHHHAQALVMAGWAASHGASESIQVLSERIIVSQRDEIGLIELWLGDRGVEPPALAEMVPTATAGGMVHDHEALMPGMLTPEEMAGLDAARAVDFDRLFLTYMIQHHQGALDMVDTLFATDGGGVDDTTYKFASDTFADQGSEIDRMQRMLAALTASQQ